MTPEQEAKERSQFEAWLISRGFNEIDLLTYQPHKPWYINDRIERMWEGWKERASRQ